MPQNYKQITFIKIVFIAPTPRQPGKRSDHTAPRDQSKKT